MVKTSVITIRDVAKESGFSSTTVSIVLNDAPLARYIPPATKKRIEKAAKKLGYRPNLFARSLRSKRSHTVGVMVFDMTDPYCTLILRGIENSLYQSSFLPILTDVHNERSRFERYLEMLLDRRVEALIVLANWLFVDIDVLADLEKSSIPSIMIARELQTDSVSSVIVDNEMGGYSAVEHLHSLGHRKIAFIRGPKTLGDSAPRWQGVRSFAKSLKPPIRLSMPALETLAVIAYKQPVTVPEISEIRGVDSSGVIATLLDRKLITTGGRKDVIGRPILYKTTKEFLLRFGLKDVNELPSMEEFEKLVAESFQSDLMPAEETRSQDASSEVADSQSEPGQVEAGKTA
jgi:hypothetical protein